MARLKGGGGWRAIRYTLRKAREVGPLRLWRAMRAKNACKTCALGMGGQAGGMADEAGHFPEVCKKSLQAMAADMRGRIAPSFFESFTIEQLRALSPRELEAAGRIVQPVILRHGDGLYRPIAWEEALDLVADRLGETDPERAFFYSSGRSSNEAGFFMSLLARAYGTNHVNNCSFYCHQASGVGLKDSIGQGTATVRLEDIEACDALFLIGGNPASNHPRLMTQLAKLRWRGGKVVVVNPVREPGLVEFRVPSMLRSLLFDAKIATIYVQPTIGGDIAFLAAVAKRLLEHAQVDRGFIASSTEGFGELEEFLNTQSMEVLSRSSGVPIAQIEEVADVYAASERAIFAWSMGITHHEHGVQNVQWIANLALLRGMVGKPGAGLLPIRGHSNVQGLGTVGVTPAVKEAALKKMHELGLNPPEAPGYDTLGALEASGRGEMDFGLCLGGNLYGASPDAAFVRDGLARLKTLVYLSTTLNTGHAHGVAETTLVLPVQPRDEESQSTTQESMFNFVRLSDGGPARHEGPRSEVEVLAAVAERLFVRKPSSATLNWTELKSHDAIRSLIAKLVPELEPIAEIGQTKKEFHIRGRHVEGARFGTPNGRARFRAHPIPALPPLGANQIRLMTGRSEGQFNTVVYEEEDVYRGQDRRDVILMNPADMARLRLGEDQPVRVSTDAGELNGILARPFDVAPGCALMYYPEANALLPRIADPRSKTPAFKSTVVSVEPLEDASNSTPNGPRAKRRRAEHQKLKAC